MQSYSQEPFATETEWYNFYKGAGIDYYYKTYPFIQSNGYVLPLDHMFLWNFFVSDMKKRNLDPYSSPVLNNYEELFSYWLANYPLQGTGQQFTGKTALQYWIEAIPQGLSKTVDDIKKTTNDVLSGSLEALKYIAIIAVILFLAYIFTRK